MEMQALTLFDTASGAKARISLFGATVISWTAGGQERLFLSDKAVLNGSKAIRGGIPPVFPVFGKATSGPCASLPQHGFARNTLWRIKTKTDVAATLCLCPDDLSPESRRAWPYAFELNYIISLEGPTLTTRLEINNTDTKDFEFQTLLHTYFRVGDIANVGVHGLQGITYKDKLTSSDVREDAAQVPCVSETDRVYPGVRGTVAIYENDKAAVEISRDGLPDIVLWNPWQDCHRMADFAPATGYKQMVCVEAGAVSEWHSLTPNTRYIAQQVITARL